MDEILAWAAVALGEESRTLFQICSSLHTYLTFKWIWQGGFRYMCLILCFLEEVRTGGVSIRSLTCRYLLVLSELKSSPRERVIKKRPLDYNE